MADAVEIHGLKELRRGLRQFPGDANRAVKAAHRKVAELVVEEAPRQASRAPGSRGSGSNKGLARYARSLKNSPTVGGARVVSNLPDAYGQEFGAFAYRQFPTWSGQSTTAGYVGYAALRARHNDIADEYLDALMDAMSSAYPEKI